ncbi:MAG: response regulator transcription factor [Chloroflexi bacterium]|nr:response regulator transcription factor [Chloroflexota bacterium]
MAKTRILLADDHDLFREGLAGLINNQKDLEVVGHAVDGLEALALVRDLTPDLIVMDIKMPICDGLEATRLIRPKFPEILIVILTVHDEDEKLFEAIKAGANGYLLKETDSTSFLSGIREAIAGGATLAPKLAASLLDEFANLANRRELEHLSEEPPKLTSREREVLNLIAAKATNLEISSRLLISLHTVKSHVRSILSKLHAVNRRHAAVLGEQQGLVKKDEE